MLKSPSGREGSFGGESVILASKWDRRAHASWLMGVEAGSTFLEDDLSKSMKWLRCPQQWSRSRVC